jgi:hypothetical protein
MEIYRRRRSAASLEQQPESERSTRMRLLAVVIVVVMVMVSLGALDAFAGQAAKPFQLALFSPIQIREESASITALRLNIIYGKNVSVSGLDIGIANHCTGGMSLGLQYGLVGLIEGDFMGWQDNAISITEGSFTGFQSGLYNHCGKGEGFQLGFVNRATGMRGLQVGLVNYTETMYGLQIGLVNIIRSKERLPVFVIANWSF